LNSEPSTWIEYDLQVGKCTSRGVAAGTALMGWNILTLSKTLPQSILTHLFQSTNQVTLLGNNANFTTTPHIS
jgi:hypothetical protein